MTGERAAITLAPGRLTLADLRRIARGEAVLALDPASRPAVDAAHHVVTNICAGERAVYGINTGFGKLAQSRIPADQLHQLQRNLVLSHAAGVGEPLPASTVRMVLALKANALVQGHSGVRWMLLETLTAMLRADVLPVIPSQGSVGASGDLAPLAHMATAMLGIGEVDVAGERRPAEAALRAAGLEPVDLAPKEGLALLNGTQVSTALALDALFAGEDTFAAAVVAGTMSVDAARASAVPFDPRINALRAESGQRDVAAVYADLLDGSPILDSHRNCGKVQDPYCLRCQPQVMGAVLDNFRGVADALLTEANGVSDNPLVFPDTGEVLSGGNFHAEPVAMAADRLAVALAEMGSLSERRIALLIDPNFSDLPPFLVDDPGVDSGFMIAQVTAAALASENKGLAHPASVDSIPTSAGQEDHVSMATHGARRTGTIAANVRHIVAIELLAAAQGIEFLRPLTSTDTLEGMLATLRAAVPRYDRDRWFAPDIAAAERLVDAGAFADPTANLLPSTSAN
jgi:histidine ammonia-lyase